MSEMLSWKTSRLERSSSANIETLKTSFSPR